MKDFLGNELKVGDEVVFIFDGELVIGTVADEGVDRYIRVDVSREFRRYRWEYDVIKAIKE